MKSKVHCVLALASTALLLAFGAFRIGGGTAASGLWLVGSLVAAALAVRGWEKLKGYSYTVWIFAAVAASLFYPGQFLEVGGFQTKTAIVPLLQVIMFGMGSQMSLQDFNGVVRMPKGVIVGLLAQFTIMPLVGYAIARLFAFPPEIAAGIILIGCVPSGLASNVMSYLARANLALAITLAAVTTLVSPFMTPLLMRWLGGQYIEVNFWSMMLDILNMIILPIVAGFIFNLFAKPNGSPKSKWIQLTTYAAIILLTNLVYLKSRNAPLADFVFQFAKSVGWFFLLPMLGALGLVRFLKGDVKFMEKILAFVSMAGIAVIISIITASGRDSLLQVGALLLVTSLLHNGAGYILGYWLAWLVGMPERDRRTIAFEVGMQNGGLASGLALQMGKIATVGLAPAIFGPLMNVTGSILANYWRSRPVKDPTVDETGASENAPKR